MPFGALDSALGTRADYPRRNQAKGELGSQPKLGHFIDENKQNFI